MLHLLPDLAVGGGQVVVRNLVAHADPARADVRVAHLGGCDDLAADFAAAGARPVALGDGRTPEAVLAARLARLLRRDAIDVVHVHSGPDRRVGQAAALVTRRPVVGHLHGEWIHLGPMVPAGAGRLRTARAHALGVLRDRLEAATVRGYVATSESVAARFRPLVRVPVVVVTPTVDVERLGAAADPGASAAARQELGLDPGGPVLVTVARVDEGKGHADLLDVVERLAPDRPDLALLVAGDGPLRPALEADARRRGLDRHVRWLGRRGDLPRLLAAADLFVFASSTEGFGLAPLEAMAAGRAVAAYDLPTLRAFGGDAVALVEPRSAALAEAVGDLLDDPEGRDAAGRVGRTLAARFHPRTAAAACEDVWTSVVRGELVDLTRS